jgi:hypothetical protein
MSMNYEVKKSSFCPSEWVVEAINYAGDGEVYVTLFSGPAAQERAEEYAQWKSASAKASRKRVAAAR